MLGREDPFTKMAIGHRDALSEVGFLDMLLESPLFSVVRRIRDTAFPALVCAHRGDTANAPENTLAAFERAIACESELIEFDIRQSADGQLVVIHDAKVDRTTDSAGDVSHLSWEELKDMDAGSWFSPRFAGEGLPLLDWALDMIKDKAIPMVEVKDKASRSPGINERLASMLKRHNMVEKAVVIMREKNATRIFEKQAPGLTLALVTLTGFQARALTKHKRIHGADHYYKATSFKLVQELHQAGLFITPWTVNRRRDMVSCLSTGCGCVITDCPILLRDVITEFEVERCGQELFDGFSEADIEFEEDSGGPEKQASVMESGDQTDEA